MRKIVINPLLSLPSACVDARQRRTLYCRNIPEKFCVATLDGFNN